MVASNQACNPESALASQACPSQCAAYFLVPFCLCGPTLLRSIPYA
jgi:hypothetical protein